MKARLTAVVGPTASGKSALALELAQRDGAEIVSADSVQIYRHLDIGSAKPTPSEMGGVRHHLLDCADPRQAIDARRFVELADAAIEDIVSRDRPVVVCGGTFLWVRALLYGLAEAPPADPRIRERHRELAERFGRPYLHDLLARVDPECHRRLGENDFVRVSRALEVHELSGRRLSDIQAEHGFRTPRYEASLCGVERSRSELYTRIEARTREMFRRGFVAEVRGLLAKGLGDARPLRSVGYRQVVEAVLGGESLEGDALDRLEQRVAQATRSFVRHQMTWLRDQPVRWVRSAGECPTLARGAT